MPSTRDIRRRIKSVTSTAQITKAMQMVASSKMQKAQQGAINFRPFAAMVNLNLATPLGVPRRPHGGWMKRTVADQCQYGRGVVQCLLPIHASWAERNDKLVFVIFIQPCNCR